MGFEDGVWGDQDNVSGQEIGLENPESSVESIEAGVIDHSDTGGFSDGADTRSFFPDSSRGSELNGELDEFRRRMYERHNREITEISYDNSGERIFSPHGDVSALRGNRGYFNDSVDIEHDEPVHVTNVDLSSPIGVSVYENSSNSSNYPDKNLNPDISSDTPIPKKTRPDDGSREGAGQESSNSIGIEQVDSRENL